ncbi:nucleoside phosphorylase domain-containing protein [Parachaetomium inaequale]|uniref:Nucleoside phosphorylase domain-containing protein n=1 Tax=Parachaetomium inaequale TaxID=2588326 RepID=A0AAN6SW51_9PEZI|nr:nucleoside phosphorylase domain-containing protein [Parachaetomium inaequale]
MASAPLSERDDFEVAVICALPTEYNAVSLLFDEFWDHEGDKYGRASGDSNHYTTGRVGKYNVVLALLPHMGTIDAASAAASMRSSYRALKLALLVGVCGGVPQGEHGEVLLGDVIISKSVVQYDFGRQYPDQFVRKDTIGDNLGRPNKNIRSLLAWFETDRGMETLERRTADFLQQLQANAAKSKRAGKDKYRYPGAARDQPFRADYRHKHYIAATCLCRDCLNDSHPVCDAALDSSCDDLGCDKNQLILVSGEIAVVQAPALYIGAVASGDMVIKSAVHRDKIASKEKVIAFEMEGAGIWDEVPCIVVKGVCDYADSHKHKGWQNFAAATAASAAKAILERYVQTDKPTEAASNNQTAGNDMSRAAHHDRPGADAQGPVFHGPINGRNVIAGSSVTGGTVRYDFK